MSNTVIAKIVQSMVKFLQAQVNSGSLSEETAESVEVAMQCLSTSYNIGEDLKNAIDLIELFAEHVPIEALITKEDAEMFKSLGNNCMKEGKYADAVEAYTSAIKADPANAIYYCNRAAANSNLNNNIAAIYDCKKAVEIDPNYSKAYSRLGFSYSSLGKHKEARDSYYRACEIEPENDTYRSNLTLAEQQIQQAGDSGPIPNVAGFDLNSLMQNREIMNIATQMLHNPNLRSMMENPVLRSAASEMLQNASMQNLISGFMNSQSGGVEESNIENIVGVSRDFAEQIQAGSPDLMEVLRLEVCNIIDNSSGTQTDGPPPPNDDSGDTKPE